MFFITVVAGAAYEVEWQEAVEVVVLVVDVEAAAAAEAAEVLWWGGDGVGGDR